MVRDAQLSLLIALCQVGSKRQALVYENPYSLEGFSRLLELIENLVSNCIGTHFECLQVEDLTADMFTRLLLF